MHTVSMKRPLCDPTLASSTEPTASGPKNASEGATSMLLEIIRVSSCVMLMFGRGKFQNGVIIDPRPIASKLQGPGRQGSMRKSRKTVLRCKYCSQWGCRQTKDYSVDHLIKKLYLFTAQHLRNSIISIQEGLLAHPGPLPVSYHKLASSSPPDPWTRIQVLTRRYPDVQRATSGHRRGSRNTFKKISAWGGKSRKSAESVGSVETSARTGVRQKFGGYAPEPDHCTSEAPRLGRRRLLGFAASESASLTVDNVAHCAQSFSSPVPCPPTIRGTPSTRPHVDRELRIRQEHRRTFSAWSNLGPIASHIPQALAESRSSALKLYEKFCFDNDGRTVDLLSKKFALCGRMLVLDQRSYSLLLLAAVHGSALSSRAASKHRPPQDLVDDPDGSHRRINWRFLEPNIPFRVNAILNIFGSIDLAIAEGLVNPQRRHPPAWGHLARTIHVECD
ncbi:hypothetical protein BV25DRAFT_1842473 [Artomyces pyxidatus]|uniref:Uncharacterized protein n=1 Tax=Artomyces pyxidatus TaxID=48021 RepID=A0ACB8SIF4_9AGAM|nr:hypothetical protein BV25DRAFT_1842473 [Artomyces pyxidatus]